MGLPTVPVLDGTEQSGYSNRYRPSTTDHYVGLAQPPGLPSTYLLPCEDGRQRVRCST